MHDSCILIVLRLSACIRPENWSRCEVTGDGLLLATTACFPRLALWIRLNNLMRGSLQFDDGYHWRLGSCLL